MELENGKPSKAKLIAWIVVIVLLLAATATGYYFCGIKNKPNKNTETNSTQSTTVSETIKKTWQEQSIVVPGQYADADVIDLGNGSYRLYYSAEPEMQGFNGQVYSSISTDGINWTKEDGVRKTWATFPDVVKLRDGKYRMYYQNAGEIKSATSTDGLTWVDESGIRINKNESGYNLENVGAGSTTILSDSTYVMVYRGTINQKYQTTEKVPNQDTELYFYATSTDGLNFTKKGLAIDSRNETLYGLADGADWSKWDSSTSAEQDEMRVYFWSYAGIYHTIYSNGVFSAPAFDWTNNKNSQVKFTENPPCDPTLVEIGDKRFMFYGQHSKGAYYATFE